MSKLLTTLCGLLAALALTIPVFFPIVIGLGFDPVWFGVLVVLVVQIGLTSPPVGLVLVLKFQPLSLWLPGMMR